MRSLASHGMLGVALLGASVALLAILAISKGGGAEPIHWNDTIISTRETYNNTTIIVDGNLTIQTYGYLELSGCDLVINASLPGQYTVDVKRNGHLTMYDTDVSSGAGTFNIRTSGEWYVWRGRLSGLNIGPVDSGYYGWEVEGGGVTLWFTEFEDGRFALHGTSVGFIVMNNVVFSGDSPLFLLENEMWLVVQDSRLATLSDGPIVRTRSGAHAEFINCTFINGTRSTLDANIVDVIEGRDNSDATRMINCTTLLDIGRYSIQSGVLVIRDERDTSGMDPHIDLKAVNSSLELSNLTLDAARLTGGTVRLWGVVLRDVGFSDGCAIHSYGTDVPPEVYDTSTTLHQYYSTDFQLLNETRAPTEGLFLVVETRDGVEVADEVSGPGGWVRGVWLRAWTRHGGSFSYEPPHRVEFGDVDYSITSVQVFGNATVVLWNSVDQRDLSLVPDAVDVTDRSPREGDPFDVVVDGRRLVPYAYDGGTADLALSVDGRVVQSQVTDIRARRTVTFRAINLTEGLHELAIVMDPDDAVLELNEGGNDEVRFIVEVASRNYTGFEIDLYVRIVRMVDTGGGDEEPLEPGVIEVEYSVRARYSQTAVRNVKVAVYVDGAEWNSAWVDLTRLQEGEYIGSGRLPINLPAGTFEIEVRVDPSGEFDERYENNNLDSRSVRVEEPPVEPFLDLWDQPLLCLAMGVIGVVAVAYMYRRSRGPVVPAPPSASPPPPSPREMRTELVGYPCPQCGRGHLTGYADGSALCKDCKAVIAPRR